MKRLTPVLLVESIEPHLAFWETLGFERTAEVPHGDGLGFVGLSRGECEVMLQSRASLADDLPELAAERLDHSGFSLFVEIDIPFDELTALLARTGAEVLVPDRRTFYGAREIGVRTNGMFVVFAAFDEDDDEGAGD